MTISPSQAEARATELGRLYGDAEAEILALIARRLAEGFDSPVWAEVKLADLGRLRREVEAEIARLTDAGAYQLRLLLPEAYETGINGANGDLRTARIEPVLRRTNVQAVEAFVNEAVLQLQSTHLAILRQSQDAYRQAVAEGARLGAAGAETRRQATQRVLDELANRGVSGFVDSAGRRWELQTYAEMATRTALGRAAVQGHIDTLTTNRRDLVIVSDSPEECHLCRPWEGKVLTVSGGTRGRFLDGEGNDVAVAGTVDEARAAGLFHANCSHRLGLFVPGLTKPMHDTANPQGFQDRQKQRYLERNIRKWKRREAVALDDAQGEYAKRHRRDAQRRMREFIDEKDRRRRYDREQVLT